MTVLRRTSKRGANALLLGCLLVGCSSVIATSQEGSERRPFVNIHNSNRDKHERKLWKDEGVLVTHGNTIEKTEEKSHQPSNKVLVTHGNKDKKTDEKSSQASNKVLITHGPKANKVDDYGYKRHKESDFVLVTHGAHGQVKTVLVTHDYRKGGSKRKKGKSKSTKSKGMGKDTKGKGKGKGYKEKDGSKKSKGNGKGYLKHGGKGHYTIKPTDFPASPTYHYPSKGKSKQKPPFPPRPQPTSPANATPTEPPTDTIATEAPMMTKVPQPPSGTAEGPDLSETLFPTEDQVHQRCNCQLCLNGVLREDGIGEMSINGVIRRTRCNKWYEAACDFPETCDEFRAGVGTECCDNTQSPINQTKAPNVAPTSAPEECVCNLCPEDSVIDENQTSTAKIGKEVTTRCCKKWASVLCNSVDKCEVVRPQVSKDCCVAVGEPSAPFAPFAPIASNVTPAPPATSPATPSPTAVPSTETATPPAPNESGAIAAPFTETATLQPTETATPVLTNEIAAPSAPLTPSSPSAPSFGVPTEAEAPSPSAKTPFPFPTKKPTPSPSTETPFQFPTEKPTPLPSTETPVPTSSPSARDVPLPAPTRPRTPFALKITPPFAHHALTPSSPVASPVVGPVASGAESPVAPVAEAPVAHGTEAHMFPVAEAPVSPVADSSTAFVAEAPVLPVVDSSTASFGEAPVAPVADSSTASDEELESHVAAPSRPPTAKEETSLPSLAAEPTISPTVLGAALGKNGLTQKVAIDPFVLQVVGTFESPSNVFMVIVESVDELMAPYLEGQIGEGVALDEIGIKLSLRENEAVAATEPSKSETTSTVMHPGYTNGRSLRDLQATTNLVLDASGNIDISGKNKADLDKYNRERVTKIIKDFFDGVPLQRLYEKLNARGLVLTEIVIEGEETDPFVKNENPTPSSDEDDDNSSFALFAGLLGGGIVLLGLAAALLISSRRRQRCNRGINDHLRSGSESLSGAQENDVLRTRQSGTHVSFPNLFDDERSQEGSLKAIKGKKTKKKKKCQRGTSSSESWASMASRDNRNVKNKHLAPISARDLYYGEDEDVFLSPVEL